MWRSPQLTSSERAGSSWRRRAAALQVSRARGGARQAYRHGSNGRTAAQAATAAGGSGRSVAAIWRRRCKGRGEPRSVTRAALGGLSLDSASTAPAPSRRRPSPARRSRWHLALLDEDDQGSGLPWTPTYRRDLLQLDAGEARQRSRIGRVARSAGVALLAGSSWTKMVTVLARTSRGGRWVGGLTSGTRAARSPGALLRGESATPDRGVELHLSPTVRLGTNSNDELHQRKRAGSW